MGKRLTEEEFIKRFQEGVLANKYDYSKVKYSEVKNKVEIICPIHGVFWQLAQDHWHGRGCAECGKNTYDWEAFKHKANKKHNNKYKYPDQVWEETRQKVVIQCPQHGEFVKVASTHLNGQGCPSCTVLTKKLNWEIVLPRCIEVHKDKYDYSKVDYQGKQGKIEIICPEHGSFWQRAEDHSRGCGCRKCAGMETHDMESFLKRARDIHGEKYDYSRVKLYRADTLLEIGCPEHGFFFQKCTSHLVGKGCLTCNESQGEKKIRVFLENNKYTYIPQQSYPNCRWKKPLPFDFYLPNYDLLLEVQGKQHYEFIKFFHGTLAGFKKQQAKDKIKKEYAEANHKFLVIPYWDFDNIEEILEKEINKLK